MNAGYRAGDPAMPGIMDRYITGNWGEDAFEGADNAVCCACGSEIFPEEEHYKIGEERYCMDCGTYADEAILEAVRDNFITEGI